ncbi:hypothetical protein F66182_8973 [Fusarium sp. NRRL 66182]|nr:hypothetical protein F66182_8973 [Fusarium sp. NRRL 66182]
MTRTFPSIQFGLMVGIGGGVPSKVDADVRLGDVVVGTRVMRYDLEKVLAGGEIKRIAIPKAPKSSLSSAVMTLRAIHELQPSRIPVILQEKIRNYPEYSRPGTPDHLFQASYRHEASALDCRECDRSQLKERQIRQHQHPMIHHGGIASGNRVMKDATTRDSLAQELDVICFEMETAGLMDILPCLPIRGICDYSDSHKTKDWQRYAAATAAAYAREFLEVLAPDHNATREPRYIASSDQVVSIQHRKQLLESLKFQQMDSRKTNIKAAYSKTCQWFLKHPDYLAWLDHEKRQQHHGYLWIRGKPGAGKSIIMKFIYTRMRKKDQHQKALTASFFFNARGEYLEKSIPGMYRSLLLQLLEGFPDLQQVLDDSDLVPRDQITCPSLNVLKDLFRTAVSSLGCRSFACFIDALDECDEQQVMDMVEFFEELAEQCTENGTRLQICFSSRHYPYIDIQSGIRLTLESQDGHTKDLETYIENHLRIKDRGLVQELKPMILEKAAGIFLWVALVVSVLNKEYSRGRPALRKRLAEVPSGLSELFKDLLRRDQENMEDLLLSILWILFAQRPLKPREYYHALWSGLSFEGLDDLGMPDFNASDTSDFFNRYVISSSKGLAEIAKAKQPTVQFIHESVRDFLIKDKGLHELWPELGVDWESHGHERLKSCCSAYLDHQKSNLSLSRQNNATSIDREYLLKQYPLLEYASLFLLSHANAAGNAISQQQFLNGFRVADWIQIVNIFEKYKIRRYSQEADVLYILADRGHSTLIRTRLKENPNIDIQGGRYGYPVLAAIAKCHKDSVAALLGLSSSMHDGTDIFGGLKCKMDSVRDYHTPFSWACENGHLAMAKILFQRGTCSDEIYGRNWTGLIEAVKNGHLEVAKWLVGKGIAIEVQGYDGQTPLSWAAMKGDEAMVQLLLEKEADIETKDHLGQAPLLQAAGRGDKVMVQLLLDRGADTETKAKNNDASPLSRAVERGDEAIVQLLLDRGADIETKDCSGQTPLSHAIRRGGRAMVQLLVERGANTMAKTKHDDPSPLSRAIERGDEAIVQLLLDKGADIEIGGYSGLTPLSHAVWRGERAVVQLLLEKGANIDGKGTSYGLQPLYVAVKMGYRTMVQLLLESGADVEVADNHGQTPLFIAARKGDKTIVQMLFEKGADIDKSDVFNRTPLHIAAKQGHKDIVHLLLEKGADKTEMDGGGRTPGQSSAAE